MDSRENIKAYFLKEMECIRPEIRTQLAERATDNLIEYYRLLRSTQIPGMEKFIAEIENSTFKTSRCDRHHAYQSGTLEHCIGVYRMISKKAEEYRKQGFLINENDLILVGLLHDICNGKHDDWQFRRHGLRSRNIIELYLTGISNDVTEAIEKHMHGGEFEISHRPRILREPKLTDNILHYLMYWADTLDAGTCNRGYVKISETEVVSKRG